MSKAETLLLWIPAVVDVTRFEIALGCPAIGFLKGHPHGNQQQLHAKTTMLATPFLGEGGGGVLQNMSCFKIKGGELKCHGASWIRNSFNVQ